MNYGKWALILTPVVLIAGFIAYASVSEHAAQNKAKSFCSNFKPGDDFNAAMDQVNAAAASDKLLNKENHLAIMFSSYDPQSVYACEIDGKDGKIIKVHYSHLAQE
jgi:hypothetical protein